MGKKRVTKPTPPLEPKQEDILPVPEREDVVKRAQKIFSKLPNLPLTLMPILAGVVTLIIGVVGILGFLEIGKWRDTREKIDNKAKEFDEKAKELNVKAVEFAEKAKEIDNKILDIAKTIRLMETKLKESEEGIIAFKGIRDEMEGKVKLIAEVVKGIRYDLGEKVKVITEDVKGAKEFREEVENEIKLISRDATILRELRGAAGKRLIMLRDEIGDASRKSLTEEPTEQDKRQLSKFDRAARRFKELGGSLTPVDYSNLGYIQYHKGEFEEALDDFNKVVELNPDFAIGWNRKGFVLGDLGRNEEALKVFDKAIGLKPDYPEAWNNKGLALGNLNRHEEALKAFEKTTELKPDYPEAWSNKGLALGSLNRHEEALKAYNQATALEPDLAMAWYGRARVYVVKGDKEKTLSDLKRAIELSEIFKDIAINDDTFEDLSGDEGFESLVE